MDDSPTVETFPRQATYGMVERRRQCLNLARCPAENLRTMVIPPHTEMFSNS